MFFIVVIDGLPFGPKIEFGSGSEWLQNKVINISPLSAIFSFPQDAPGLQPWPTPKYSAPRICLWKRDYKLGHKCTQSLPLVVLIAHISRREPIKEWMERWHGSRGYRLGAIRRPWEAERWRHLVSAPIASVILSVKEWERDPQETSDGLAEKGLYVIQDLIIERGSRMFED